MPASVATLCDCPQLLRRTVPISFQLNSRIGIADLVNLRPFHHLPSSSSDSISPPFTFTLLTASIAISSRLPPLPSLLPELSQSPNDVHSRQKDSVAAACLQMNHCSKTFDLSSNRPTISRQNLVSKWLCWIFRSESPDRWEQRLCPIGPRIASRCSDTRRSVCHCANVCRKSNGRQRPLNCHFRSQSFCESPQ
jgi:hypothetical protein